MRAVRFGLLGLGFLLAGCPAAPPVEVVSEQPVLAAPSPVVTVPLDDAQQLGADTVAVLNSTGTPASQPSAPASTTADDTILITQQSGLVERLPNTCQLQNYQQFQGQSQSVLATAAIDRAWRVVQPEAIISQEYNPGRLNFYTNGAGQIQRITCG